MKLPFNMTKTPEGWPVMTQAFIDFAMFAFRSEDIQEHFKNDTGIELKSLIPKTGLDEMIDEATGRNKEVVSQFMDWLVINHWGQQEEKTECPHAMFLEKKGCLAVFDCTCQKRKD